LDHGILSQRINGRQAGKCVLAGSGAGAVQWLTSAKVWGCPMKVREIIKCIEMDGWYRIKSKSGHRQFKHPVKPGRVTVPGQLNADLDKKTEKSILNQAGLAD